MARIKLDVCTLLAATGLACGGGSNDTGGEMSRAARSVSDRGQQDAVDEAG